MGKWLKDISTPDFSTPSFNPGPFNPRLFNHELFNPMVQKFMVGKSGVEKFMVGSKVQGWSLGLKSQGLKCPSTSNMCSCSRFHIGLRFLHYFQLHNSINPTWYQWKWQPASRLASNPLHTVYKSFLPQGAKIPTLSTYTHFSCQLQLLI